MEKGVIGYVRSLVVDDNNIAHQKKELNDYCKENRLRLNRIFEDNGVADKSLDREGLSQLFEFLQKSKDGTKTLILTNLDRLSRDYFVFAEIRRKINGYRIKVISLNKGLNVYVFLGAGNKKRRSNSIK